MSARETRINNSIVGEIKRNERLLFFFFSVENKVSINIIADLFFFLPESRIIFTDNYARFVTDSLYTSMIIIRARLSFRARASCGTNFSAKISQKRGRTESLVHGYISYAYRGRHMESYAHLFD